MRNRTIVPCIATVSMVEDANDFETARSTEAGHASWSGGSLRCMAKRTEKRLAAAFKQGLNENGFVEGQNVKIEYRWADRHLDQLSELAAALVHLRPDVLVGTGGVNAAAIAATKTIPVVVSFGGDPVKLGYVASLKHRVATSPA